MNKSMYFLVPVILIIAGLIGYNLFGKQDRETLPIAETTATHETHADGDSHATSVHMKSTTTISGEEIPAFHNDAGTTAHKDN